MITEAYCKEILQSYPEYISKDQMYQICHISKKTCLFLLENGLVPNVDSKKKTRRFKIKTKDVIEYLRSRDDYPELYRAPKGYYSGTGCKKAPSFPKVYSEEDLTAMRNYYKKKSERLPDVMTVAQIADFTGYCRNSVGKWCSKKQLSCFYIKRKFQIPKEYLLDFLVSRYFIGIAVKSKKHLKFEKDLKKILDSHI